MSVGREIRSGLVTGAFVGLVVLVVVSVCLLVLEELLAVVVESELVMGEGVSFSSPESRSAVMASTSQVRLGCVTVVNESAGVRETRSEESDAVSWVDA